MNAVTCHRGPDGTGVHAEAGVTLAHNRLAIIDLSPAAAQPMTDASGRYVLVFNGEIYNFKELREELRTYPFRTESDTEVVLAAYAKWGREAFARLNGIFALALWNRGEKTLVLARDAAGVKPLHYHASGGKLLFSSETKALLAAGVAPTLDQDALGHYLRLMFVPDPQSLLKELKSLPKGHTLTFSEGAITIEPFTYQPTTEPSLNSYAEACEAVNSTVRAAVTRQLVSDRPVGIYLSGGIDSSTVLACATATHPRINTYSVGFALGEGEEREKFNRDSELARRTAAHYGAEHHEYLLSPDDALALVTETAAQLDEPVGNATAVAQQFLAKQVKPDATVVLSGEGGDELFGGYDRYRLALGASRIAPFVPRSLAARLPRLANLHQQGIDRFAQLMFQKDAALSRVLSKEYALPDTRSRFDEYFAQGDIATELMQADEDHWLVREALMRADRTGMAAGVEVRVPLLDLEVVSLAHRLPRPYKVTPFSTKRVLKDAFRDVLPPELFSEPKRGWFSPGAKWLRHPGCVALADEVFTESYAPGVAPLFDFAEIRALWHAHREQREYHFTLLWALLVFFIWARTYKVTV